MKKIFLMTCILMIALTAGCGPSSEELAVTDMAQTDMAEAQTQAAMPTKTQVPTSTPAPTETITPTPTPELNPNPVIKLQDLGLSDDFAAYPPADQGIEVGTLVYLPRFKDGITVAGSFYFANDERTQLIYGYTVLLPDFDIQKTFSMILAFNMDSLVSESFDVPEDSVHFISSAINIGHLSMGVHAPFIQQGETWQVSLVSFMVGADGEIGANVFVLNRADVQSPISVEDVADVYANKIMPTE